jgi:hypothetical protein
VLAIPTPPSATPITSRNVLGPKERALVAEQACVQALAQDYAVASKNSEAMGSAMMMQVRTRFIEERMEEAIKNGALQLVILGAGFDTRAYRFMELLPRLHVLRSRPTGFAGAQAAPRPRRRH